MTHPLPADDTPSMARWLLARLDRIRHHPAGDQAFDEITSVVRSCWAQVNRPSDDLYLGVCKCGGEISMPPHSEAAHCRECREPYSKEDMLAYADDRLATAREIERLMKVFGQPVTAAMIRGYAHRSRLAERATSHDGRPMYRVGDVRDLATKAAEQRKAS